MNGIVHLRDLAVDEVIMLKMDLKDEGIEE